MRLLSSNADGSFSLTEFARGNIPKYAILSHTWEADDQEVTFKDMINLQYRSKKGHRKIQFCAEQAKRDGLQYFWVDSCCIDRSSSAELQETINSMFKYYRDAAKCYVYLSDVSTGKHSRSSNRLWESSFKQSRWFTRGWTLQELLAPHSVEFFSRDGRHLGDKNSLEQQIHEITGIAVPALQGNLFQFSYNERRNWAEKRETTYEEDQVYCLLGIFDVYLPLIYGEGKENAFRRLQDEIDRRSMKWSDTEQKCMQALRTSAFNYEEFKDRNPSRLKGTCQWVLQHKNFRSWKDSHSSGLLWVSADPGCGKSVLSKSLVDEDFKRTETRTICYFFFKDDNNIQKNIATALSALLHQLFSQKPALIKHAMSGFADNGDKMCQSFDTLWGILTKAAADPAAGELFCILDALDECAESGRYQMIDALKKLFEQVDSGLSVFKFKFLITSRPYLDIERRFTGLTRRFPTIRLCGEKESEDISREIDIVIKWNVAILGQELELDNLERSTLEKGLLGMQHRTYLWLKLILEVIRDEVGLTKTKLKQIIGTLPRTVDQAYESILSKAKDQVRARKLLCIIVAATRPLTLKEMNIALTIENHHKCCDDLDLERETTFESSLRHLCGLFVAVVDQKVYLIHQTAKEFLLAKTEAVTGGWKHSLIPMESEAFMAQLCITYLSFTDFDRATDHTSIVVKYGYLDYAAESWASHYRKAQDIATKQTLQSVLRICDPASQRFKTWFHVYLKYSWLRPQLTSILMVASYFGHEAIVKLLLKAKADVDSKDGRDRTPLWWAAENGHEAVVKLLLKAKADVDSKDIGGQTPLWWAAANGHEAVVKLLLEAKADVDSKDNFNRTPLWWATANGHEAVVKLLLEAKADVDSKDYFNRTPLSYASANGHEAVVKLLRSFSSIYYNS